MARSGGTTSPIPYTSQLLVQCRRADHVAWTGYSQSSFPEAKSSISICLSSAYLVSPIPQLTLIDSRRSWIESPELQLSEFVEEC